MVVMVLQGVGLGFCRPILKHDWIIVMCPHGQCYCRWLLVFMVWTPECKKLVGTVFGMVVRGNVKILTLGDTKVALPLLGGGRMFCVIVREVRTVAAEILGGC